MKIITVIGARPQFTKCAIVSKEIRKEVHEILIHTGQHYDYKMSDSFFEELDIPSPDYNLNIGGLSHAKMTAKIMIELEMIVNKEKPDAILVYGDTDSTLAGALVASKLYIPLIHIEAGERIYNKVNVPEEINRVIVDHISNLNLCSTMDAVNNLKLENLYGKFVGDPMFDLYMLNKEKIKNNRQLVEDKYNLPSDFILLTIHRVENTLDENRLLNILSGIDKTGTQVVWPVHPRTMNLIKSSTALTSIVNKNNFLLLDPLSYLEFSTLIELSALVITDSGGVIRESYFANKFSIVPLKNSWWKNIVNAGWSIEVQDDSNLIYESINKYSNFNSKNKPLYFGDGMSAVNIKNEIVDLIMLHSEQELVSRT